MVEADFSIALDPADRAREADYPHSPVVRFARGQPLRLDAGIDLAPFQIAYQTYGTLNAERSNAVLICHALTGDQHVANLHPVTQKPGWWETMVGPGTAYRYRPLFRHLLRMCWARCMGTTGPASTNPSTAMPVGPRFPRHHHPRHGARAGNAARPSRHRVTVLDGGRLDGRHAGAAMVRELSATGVLGASDRDLDPPLGAEHRLP